MDKSEARVNSDSKLVDQNNLEEICGVLMRYRSQLAGVVVESTFNWYWLVNGLQIQELQVYFANKTATKKYNGLKHRTDESDARYLAQLFR